MIATDAQIENHKVVSEAEWFEARKAHLAKEKELTKLRDELYKERRALPWAKVEKQYTFDTPDGRKSLSDLFADRSQLIVYHFMFGPDSKDGCPGCSFICDHIDAANLHLPHHDVTLLAVARGPLNNLLEYKTRMDWKFDWVSSAGSDFNYDFHVSFTPDEVKKGKGLYNYEITNIHEEDLHGASVFYKNSAGEIFHTYSHYARGGDILLGTHNFLDLTPKGRDEKSTMDWVRRHDQYEDVKKKTHDCCK